MLFFKLKSCGFWKTYKVEMPFRPRVTKKSETVNLVGIVGRDDMEAVEQKGVA